MTIPSNLVKNYAYKKFLPSNRQNSVLISHFAWFRHNQFNLRKIHAKPAFTSGKQLIIGKSCKDGGQAHL